MDLILWRHAEAEDGFPDQGRKLTDKGERQAAKMAAWLKAHLPEKVRIIVSPTTRTRQTAAALTRDGIVVKEVGPGASVAALLGAAGWPDAKGAVVVVGHQPTLGQVAAYLLSNTQNSWSVKKGGVWWFTNRTRLDETQTILKTVMSPEFL
ncbi:phosphohistidine phosphatase [Sulfuricella sp. T08]|uniref:SixA phosphatase family protein n=1 Tax=Sulfuricella sp. T08 TaxID=1632857 RepID=UPI0006179648|nr:histidine phosphatase family protein [Sulfuricella sp. T08]GAO37834.1 phosphohistidine phosphatase [Sulfuricella sp. T08]